MVYATKYKDVLKWRNQPVREFIRNIVIRILSIGAKPNKKFKGIQFLYFHYIYEDEINNAEKIIKWINNNFNVISYSKAIEKLKKNDIDDYYICFSSDDGLKSNLVASRIFKQNNISCCFFINPATIENRDIRFHHKVCTQRLGVPLTKILTWDDVDILLAEGHEIGNHSYDHKIQGDLSREEFLTDLKKSTQKLEQKAGKIKHYAFPRGLFKYFKKNYLEEVYNHDYESCATAVRGCHILQPNDDLPINSIAVRRDVLVFNEPLAFLKYFMKSAQKKASPKNTFWDH